MGQLALLKRPRLAGDPGVGGHQQLLDYRQRRLVLSLIASKLKAIKLRTGRALKEVQRMHSCLRCMVAAYPCWSQSVAGEAVHSRQVACLSAGNRLPFLQMQMQSP